LSMASVSKMNCVRETFDEVTGEGTYLMTLSNYPIAPPFMNNIIYHDGRPTERLFSCNVSRIDHEEASSPYCRISIIEPFEGLPLYSECSNHGVCDKVVGKCACERGFKGEACNDIRDAEVGGGDDNMMVMIMMMIIMIMIMVMVMMSMMIMMMIMITMEMMMTIMIVMIMMVMMMMMMMMVMNTHTHTSLYHPIGHREGTARWTLLHWLPHEA